MPRSTSAATAAEPRPMTQMANVRTMNGWFQNAISMAGDEKSIDSPPSPRNIRIGRAAPPSAATWRIRSSIRDVA